MATAESLLPCPALPIEVAVPADAAAAIDARPLPDGPGVFVLEDHAGRCVSVTTSANVRRLVRARLEDHQGATSTPDAAAAPGGKPRPQLSRRVDYRSVTRRIRAVPVGSTFEAEWAWLQLARRHAPASCRAMLDRWQTWFIHVDADDEFPRLVKTPFPSRSPVERGGTHLGPFADKHAAQRYIEMLQDAFDLCRYHHLLVQAPRTTACAYKQMGKCPAPCDGTVTMQAYRGSIRQAAAFAATPIQSWRAGAEQDMHAAGTAMRFEEAERCKRLLSVTAMATQPAFAFVDDLRHFRWLAVLPSESPAHIRLFAINGGWIEPIVDVAIDAKARDLGEIRDSVDRRMQQIAACADSLDAEGLENVSLVCRHLFAGKSRQRRGEFLRAAGTIAVDELARALRRVGRSRAQVGAAASDELAIDAEDLPSASAMEIGDRKQP